MAVTDNERLVVELEARINQFEKNFQRANRTASTNWTAIEARSAQAARRMESSFATASAKAKNLASSFAGAFAGGFAIGGLAQLPGLIRDTVASAARIADVADKIGLTTGRLQELRFAADQSGIATDELDRAMTQFSRRIGEAAAGGGDLAKILAANGIALRNADGSMRPLNDLLRDYAELIRHAASDQDRLALAVDGFGRSGDGMVNLLRDGASGLDALTKKAREAGAVLGDDLVRAAADVDDKFAELQARWETIAKGEIIRFVHDVNRATSELANIGNDAADAWAKFEAVWNRLARISPEDAAKQKARAELIRRAVTGETGEQDFSHWVAFAQAPKGDRADYKPPATVIPPASTGSRTSAIDDVTRERQKVGDLIASLEQERTLIGASANDQRIAAELRRAGASATEEQRSKIRALIPEIEAEKAAHDGLIARLDEARSLSQETFRGIRQDIMSGVPPMEALGNAIDHLTDRLFELAENWIFNQLLGAPGTAGSGFLGKLFGFADGGWTGDGSRDKVAGVVHGREFVVNADAAGKHRALLEMINTGRVPAGSLAAPVVRPPGGGASNSQSVTIAPSISIKVEGGSRGQEADHDLAKRVGAEVENAVRSIVAHELLHQTRQGGLLSR